MSDSALLLVSQFGLPLMAFIVMFGCIGVPMPAALSILASASFAAAGEFQLTSVFFIAFAAALVGDHIGFWIGRLTDGSELIEKHRAFSGLSRRARVFLSRHGNSAVFFSRWLVSPLGPSINILAGHSNMPWRRFTMFEVPGQIAWVSLHCTLGVIFSSYVVQVAEFVTNTTGILAAGLVVLLFGQMLWKTHQHRKSAKQSEAEQH